MQLPPVRICTLGCFELFIDDAPLAFEGRGPRKPLELLSALIAHGPRGASVATITDLLWPDADGFDAYRALVTTVHRLRHLLVYRSAVHFGAGRLRLEPNVCDIDVWRLERALDEVRDRSDLGAALDLYVGPFLADDANAWAIGTRSRLAQAVTRATRKATGLLGRRDDFTHRDTVARPNAPAPRDDIVARRDALAPSLVRHQLSPRQISNAVVYGDLRDVGATSRSRVANRSMDRRPE